MTRILACVPLAFDATSYYRAFGVFPNLRKHYHPDLVVDNYTGGGRRTWADLLTYDILFMQRPAYPEWFKLAEYMKGLGKKVWIDHDDNLFDLPPYNRVVDTYKNPVVRKAMIDMIKLADVVTVSTPALQAYFMDNFAIKSIVIPNALNDELTPMAKDYNHLPEVGTLNIPSHRTVEQIIWRGSETHQADLMTHQEQLSNAMDKRPNTFWSFMGFDPFFVTMNFPETKWKYSASEDVMVFYNNLRSVKAQLMHVPLIEDGLNACKSNIAWIEATAAGAVTLAPNWPEWQKPGIINYNTVEHYGELLLQPFERMEERWKLSRDYINENLLLTNVNKMRSEIIDRLNPKMIDVTTKDSKGKEYITSNQK